MTDEELEVDYILWEAEDPYHRPCEADAKECPNVALYRAHWSPAKDAGDEGVCLCFGKQNLCLSCKDWVLDNNDDDVIWQCYRCDGLLDLVRIEPLL